MFRSTTPDALLSDQLHTLCAKLSGVRDGDSASVHDSRVATRRIRELLQFPSAASSRQIQELNDGVARVGKALGRVRDVDVRIELLTALEARIPPAAPWLVNARQRQEGRRRELVRRLIKRLEKQDIDRLIARTGTPSRQALRRTWRNGQWRRDLDRVLAGRAGSSREAIDRATGIYFPNRVHRVRIALKKLRYAMEIADATGRADFESNLRALKKVQDVLGDLHDRQTLLDDAPLEPSRDEGNQCVALATAVVEAEVASLHQRYLSRRPALLDLARDAEAVSIDRGWARPLVSAGIGVVLVSAGAYLAQYRSRSAGSPAPRLSLAGSAR